MVADCGTWAVLGNPQMRQTEQSTRVRYRWAISGAVAHTATRGDGADKPGAQAFPRSSNLASVEVEHAHGDGAGAGRACERTFSSLKGKEYRGQIMILAAAIKLSTTCGNGGKDTPIP
jgi:hypothetical protein